MGIWLLLASPIVLGQQSPTGNRGETGGAVETLRILIASIDSNNTTLKAIKLGVDAQKMENRTGLNPDDPKVGVNYLRPNPRLSDHRFDFGISQEFEFPTVYGHRRKVAGRQNEALDLEYELQRREILIQAIRVWLQWVYYGQFGSLLQLQHDHARQIADSYQRAFEAGQINILERNKARIHAATTRKAFDFNEIERQSAHDQLIQLNGGLPLPELDSNGSIASANAFMNWELPANVESWLALIQGRSILLDALEKEVEVARSREKLAGAMQLPNLEIGFMREQDIEVDFRGFTFGVSIPLWQHRNRVRQARLQTTAQESQLSNSNGQFELEQRNLFRKAQALKIQLDELHAVLDDTKGPELIRRALDLGEITLVEYLVEQEMYYGLMESLLQTELEYQLVQVDMRKWLAGSGIEFLQ